MNAGDAAGGKGFERDRLGWWIVGLNLAMAANSTLYFVCRLGTGFNGWFAMNSCAPSIVVFSLGYILSTRTLMAVGAGLMLRYGTMGLFVFGWDGMNIIPQAGHVLMTLALAYFIVRMIRCGGAGEIIVCLAIPLVMFYAEWQMEWLNGHPKVCNALIKGTLSPEMFR